MAAACCGLSFPTEPQAGVGFSLRLCLDASSSVFFLVFLSNLLEMDAKTFLRGLSSLLLSLTPTPPQMIFIILFIVNTV